MDNVVLELEWELLREEEELMKGWIVLFKNGIMGTWWAPSIWEPTLIS